MHEKKILGADCTIVDKSGIITAGLGFIDLLPLGTPLNLMPYFLFLFFCQLCCSMYVLKLPTTGFEACHHKLFCYSLF